MIWKELDRKFILITRRAEFHGLCPWVMGTRLKGVKVFIACDLERVPRAMAVGIYKVIMKNDWENNGVLPLSPPDDHLIKVGNLIVDLVSFEEGFKIEITYKKDIWDYIQYRQSLMYGPLLLL